MIDFSRTPNTTTNTNTNTNTRTNILILKMANTNMTFFGYLGSKIPPKLWYPNIFVPNYAGPCSLDKVTSMLLRAILSC